MKKALICIGLVLAGLSTGIFADEIYTTVVDRKIRYEGQRITTKYPVLSYDNTTYIAVRDVAKMLSKDVRWDENENSIAFSSPMERAINNYDTGETIGRAIIKEFYNDKITENSIYRTDFCGRSWFLDDTFIEEVIFEPDKNINLDDLKVKYKLIIEFSDKSNDKYVINIFDKNTVTLFPWDGNLQEDMINMDNIPARDNLYSFCIYIINKDNSSN